MAKRCPFWTDYTKTREVCPPVVGGATWGAAVDAAPLPPTGFGVAIFSTPPDPFSPPPAYEPGTSDVLYVSLINTILGAENSQVVTVEALVPGATGSASVTWLIQQISGPARIVSAVAGAFPNPRIYIGGLYPLPLSPDGFAGLQTVHTLTPTVNGTTLAPLTLTATSFWGGVF